MKADRTTLGMKLFILSEGVFFLLLVLAYVTYHREQGSGPTAASTLDLAKTSAFSVLLFASSGTMVLAIRGHRRGRRKAVLVWLAATLGLGLVFLAGQGLEYASLLHEDVTISRDLFGTTFFTLTGFHGLHVGVGLILIGTLIGLQALGGLSDPSPGAVEAASIYWHFVDGVWVVVFSVVYLWAFL